MSVGGRFRGFIEQGSRLRFEDMWVTNQLVCHYRGGDSLIASIMTKAVSADGDDPYQRDEVDGYTMLVSLKTLSGLPVGDEMKFEYHPELVGGDWRSVRALMCDAHRFLEDHIDTISYERLELEVEQFVARWVEEEHDCWPDKSQPT